MMAATMWRRSGSAAVTRGACLLLVSAWLGGCALTAPPQRDEVLQRALPATTQIPPGWHQSGSLPGEVGNNWLASFNDPQLQVVVSEALAHNPDLRQAASTVLMVAQGINLASAQMLPQIGAQVGETGTRDYDDSNTDTAHQFNVALGWELDIWGRLRAQKSAAQANYAAASLDYAFARQSLAAMTVKSWFAAVQASHLLALAQESEAVYRQLLHVSRVRNSAGKVSEFDVIQAQAALDSSEAALQDAYNNLAIARRNLELLLGRYPAAEIAVALQTDALPSPVDGSAPLSLLSRRPDVVAAEQQVRSAFRSLEADRLALLPDFSFQLEVGRFSNNLIGLLDLNPWLGHAAVGMQIPVYQGGALRAQIAIGDAQEQAAVANYGSVVLSAFNEVETGLGNEHYLSRELVYVERGVASLDKAVQLANDRYQAGASDMQSVLQLQARELATRADAIDLRYALLGNRVNLYLALGSSFDSEPMVSPQLLSLLNPDPV
ncbi:MAG: TolC family protein [Halioglobus sp.]|nr:TolC family protein [Halioglobus sp.]